MPKKIVCAGLNRSGSTLTYNAVRLILEREHGKSQIYTCLIDDYDNQRNESYHIIKAHSAESVAALGADKIITSFRDLRAVTGSFLRMRWLDNRTDHIDVTLDAYVKNFAYLQKHADLCLRYEDFAHDYSVLIDKLIVLLGAAADDELSALVARDLVALKPAYDKPSGDLSTADPTSMLHSGHIGAGDYNSAVQLLDDDMRAYIERRYVVWLLSNDYVVPKPSIVARLKELDFAASDEFGAPPIIPTDEEIFCNVSAPPGLLKSGFITEDWGSWSEGDIARFEFRTPPGFVRGTLAMLVGALTPDPSPPIVVDVFLNGVAVDTWYWRGGVDHKSYEMRIDSHGIQSVTFVIKGARSPCSLGIGPDPRRLGMAFNRVKLTPAASAL